VPQAQTFYPVDTLTIKGVVVKKYYTANRNNQFNLEGAFFILSSDFSTKILKREDINTLYLKHDSVFIFRSGQDYKSFNELYFDDTLSYVPPDTLVKGLSYKHLKIKHYTYYYYDVNAVFYTYLIPRAKMIRIISNRVHEFKNDRICIFIVNSLM
jgi:hypothetical protein